MTVAVFYRAGWVRWWLIVTGAFLAAAVSPWGPPQWRNTPSLRWLHQILPWTLVSALFAVYVLLLAVGQLHAVIVAEALGAAIYGCELVALLVTLNVSQPSNPFAVVAVALVVVLHVAAARLALIQLARA